MDKLINKLCKLLHEGNSELIDFELITGAYSRKKTDATDHLLQQLQNERLLSYTREEYGFRIKVPNMNQLKNFQAVSATGKR